MSAIQRKKTTPTSSSSSTVKPVKSKLARRKQSKPFLRAFNALSWIIVIFFVSSYIITDTWTWGYKNKWTNVNNWLPRSELVLSEQELAKYDGSNPSLPVYIAIDGEVFDVTKGRGWYAPGGSYSFFAGRDAARAYATGCFKEHLTHDLRGLGDNQLKGIENWKNFYKNHHKYHKVGTVKHKPIDPNTPIPASCEEAVPQKPKKQ